MQISTRRLEIGYVPWIWKHTECIKFFFFDTAKECSRGSKHADWREIGRMNEIWEKMKNWGKWTLELCTWENTRRFVLEPALMGLMMSLGEVFVKKGYIAFFYRERVDNVRK